MSQRFQFSPKPPSDYTLDDFRRAVANVEKISAIEKVVDFLPNTSVLKFSMTDAIEHMRAMQEESRRVRGIIDSMTTHERTGPLSTIDDSRRRRIASGAGVDLAEVDQFLKQFEGMVVAMRLLRKQRP